MDFPGKRLVAIGGGNTGSGLHIYQSFTANPKAPPFPISSPTRTFRILSTAPSNRIKMFCSLLQSLTWSRNIHSLWLDLKKLHSTTANILPINIMKVSNCIVKLIISVTRRSQLYILTYYQSCFNSKKITQLLVNAVIHVFGVSVRLQSTLHEMRLMAEDDVLECSQIEHFDWLRALCL